MQAFNFWNKLDLHRTKIILSVVGLYFLAMGKCFSQESGEINLPNSDEKKIKYGFSIGIFSSNFKLQYADIFTTEAFDSVHSINALNNFGFSLGLIANFKLAEYLDFRVSPKVGFYENKLEFLYTRDVPSRIAFTEISRVELPLLLKYKSFRMKNSRMYFIGGINPSIRVSGSKKEEDIVDRILVLDESLAVEFGFGIDLYYPLFKFSPEIRFSRGLTNILQHHNTNDVAKGIKRLTLNSVTLYLQFGD